MIGKLIVILGPTASGKSDLAVKLAKKLALSKIEGFNGAEIISADSRQVYKGLDIGSGKITKKEMKGIPHYLLGVASPKRRFTVEKFQKLAKQKIKEVQQRGCVPFLVGGTGFYIQSVVDNIAIPLVKPDLKLRKKLERKSADELFLMLKKLDPDRAASIDRKNSRRLIRAIEIVKATGKPVPPIKPSGIGHRSILQIGIKKSRKELKKAIHQRLKRRLKQGLVVEVKKLHKSSLSWKRLEELGLEYRFIAQYLQNRITYEEMRNKIQKESESFAKKQMTWFKRDKRINWIESSKEAEKLTRNFIKLT